MNTNCAVTLPNGSRSLASTKPPPQAVSEGRSRSELIDHLNKNIVNAVDLKVSAAHAAWRAWSNNNARLSKEYAEFGNDLDNLTDDMGLRMTILGGQPYGLVLRLDGATRLPAECNVNHSDSDYVSAMRASIAVAFADVTTVISKFSGTNFDTSDILQRYRQRLASMESYLADLPPSNTAN